MFEAALVQTYWQSAIAIATGVAPKAMGSAHPLNAPYQAFETADRWIVVGGANQKNWIRTLDVMGASELAEDPRFAPTPTAWDICRSWTTGSTTHLRNQARRILAGRARRSRRALRAGHRHLQALADPQTIAREMVVEVEHSTLGPREDDRTADQVLADARRGAQGRADLRRAHPPDPRRCGFHADEIAAFEREGAVVAAQARGRRRAGRKRLPRSRRSSPPTERKTSRKAESRRERKQQGTRR